MRGARRCMDREGVGGFLESILAVMVVITASSVFMVVLASSALQGEDEIERGELVSWLEGVGLYSEAVAIRIDGSGEIALPSALPEGISGTSVLYRLSGNSTPLLVLSQGDPPQGDVMAFQLPLLIEIDGRDLPGVVEVRAWR